MTKRQAETLYDTDTEIRETVKGTDILSDTHAHVAWSYMLQTAHRHTMGPTCYRQHTDTPWALLAIDRTHTDTEWRPSDSQTDFSLTLTGQGQTQQTDGQKLNSVVLHGASLVQGVERRNVVSVKYKNKII